MFYMLSVEIKPIMIFVVRQSVVMLSVLVSATSQTRWMSYPGYKLLRFIIFVGFFRKKENGFSFIWYEYC